MMVLAYEWKKLMIGQRGLACLLAALVVSGVWLAATEQPQNIAMQEHRSDYAWCLERLDGALNDQKEAWLQDESEAITEAKAARAEAQESYYSGLTSAEDYESAAAQAGEVLAHERGFDTAFQQYLYVSENPTNRYFLETNGWAGLLSVQTLDFAVLLAVLYLAAAAFCSEYACQMDALLRTTPEGRASARCKVLIVIGSAVALCVALSLLQLTFFAVKYGLPHGDYPLQSVPLFGTSEKSLTLAEAFVAAAALRCFGAVMLAALLLFASVIVRKYALTALIGAAATLIPLIGLPEQFIFRLPLPLPFLLATGFLEGGRFAQGDGGEAIAVFAEVSPWEFALVAGISAALTMLALYGTVRRSTNCWLLERRPRFGSKAKPAAALLLAVALLLPVTGCSSEAAETVVYNSAAQSLTGDGFAVGLDDETRTYTLEREGAAAMAVETSPLFGAFSDGESVTGAYVAGSCIYYLTSRTQQYIDRVGNYNSTFTQFSIVRLNADTLERHVIFEQIADSDRSLLGIDYTVGDTWAFLPDCRSFFLNDRSFFFVVNDKIVEVDRGTRSVQTLAIPASGNIAFDGRAIYFVDEDSRLQAYDTQTREVAPVGNIVARSFCLTEDGLCFVNRLDGDAVCTCAKDGSDAVVVLEGPALSVDYENGELSATLKSDGRTVPVEL